MKILRVIKSWYICKTVSILIIDISNFQARNLPNLGLLGIGTTYILTRPAYLNLSTPCYNWYQFYTLVNGKTYALPSFQCYPLLPNMKYHVEDFVVASGVLFSFEPLAASSHTGLRHRLQNLTKFLASRCEPSSMVVLKKLVSHRTENTVL